MQQVVLRRSETEVSYWVDETGSDSQREGIRKFGYAYRGLTPVGLKLGISDKCLSVTTALSSRGVEDIIDVIDGNTNGETNASWHQQLLCFLYPWTY